MITAGDAGQWLSATVHALSNAFGIAWVAVLVVLILRQLDKAFGRPLEALFERGGPLNVEYYPSLRWKYADPVRDEYSAERAWVYTHYKEYLHRAIREQGITTWKLMRKAKRGYDYRVLYNLMIDLDQPLCEEPVPQIPKCHVILPL